VGKSFPYGQYGCDSPVELVKSAYTPHPPTRTIVAIDSVRHALGVSLLIAWSLRHRLNAMYEVDSKPDFILMYVTPRVVYMCGCDAEHARVCGVGH
jgi:hypothetical protein